MPITEWTDGGRLDWSSEAAIKRNPLSPYLEALRLACVERLMVVAPRSTHPSWDLGVSPIWDCTSGMIAQQIAHEIDWAIVTLLTLASGQGAGWADTAQWPKPMTGLPSTGDVFTPSRYTVSSLADKVTPGEPFYATCDMLLASRGLSGTMPQTELFPTARWARQKYLMLNEMTRVSYTWQGNDVVNSIGMTVTENALAYHGWDVGTGFPIPCDPGEAVWMAAEADWKDITDPNSPGPPTWNWAEHGLGAYRTDNNYQYFRATFAPFFDMSPMSRPNAAGDHGYEFEKDIQVSIGLSDAGREIINNTGLQFGTYNPEIGPVDEFLEIVTEISHSALTWSIGQFPAQITLPPILDIPTSYGCNDDHWSARRSSPGPGGFGPAAWLFHLFDYAKPAGFQFV